MKICRRCLVTGKVQGVFYRQSTLEEASALNITGWVRNLTTGEVEVLICGEEAQVELMCDWLWEGSRGSQVQHVEIVSLPWQEYETFMIRK